MPHLPARLLLPLSVVALLQACQPEGRATDGAASAASASAAAPLVAPPTLASYHDGAGREDALSGGVRMIPITTPKGSFKVWTKRVGNNPRIKVLLLHGG